MALLPAINKLIAINNQVVAERSINSLIQQARLDGIVEGLEAAKQLIVGNTE